MFYFRRFYRMEDRVGCWGFASGWIENMRTATRIVGESARFFFFL